MAYYMMFGPYDTDALAEEMPDHYVNDKGKHECVEFVRQSTGAPSSKAWRPGTIVKGHQEIPRGVAIANFSGVSYLSHAAIYLGQDQIGIWVLDQWNDQKKVKRRRIKFPTGKEKVPLKNSNNADIFFVIDTKLTEEAAKKRGETSTGRIVVG